MAVETNADRLMADINVTPLVDVMLVLLIIFMVTAPMMMQGVDISLPQTTSQPLRTKQEHLIISIDANGKVFINDFQVTPDFLKEKLARILAGRSDRQVYLRADKNIPYGLVARVMAQIQAAGITNLGMVTEPPPAGKKPAKGPR